ncbi:hypothetical protein IB286_14275 [Spongiibacter sp. KMU-158]|uniref:Lipoprotein n=1 Tax=Spongiibacter pelagi TaxID=2760804 RepID=A0A927GY78_9GAMM|nr:hypothetical protein [Spongiibacter pelagi]MBD2860164.1 hypothetical protein [Spongiibacter pelagi]
MEIGKCKTLCLLGFSCILVSCAMKPYEPSASGDRATIVFNGSGFPNIPFIRKRLTAQFFSGCYTEHPKTDASILGELKISEEEFLNKEVTIPAGKFLLMSYGVSESGSCMLNASFVPEKGAQYQATYKPRIGRCEGKITKRNGDPIPDLNFYKITAVEAAVGASDTWRHCNNFNRYFELENMSQ